MWGATPRFIAITETDTTHWMPLPAAPQEPKP
ncbi:DUF551 domain-containing protein [Klebsiella pneumoniae]|nr:DUF551 domain-containing protein [Klebsiella pneumoniae]QPP62153.1 DUF551 domain-containing protein [Klebsiella pneumoniae]